MMKTIVVISILANIQIASCLEMAPGLPTDDSMSRLQPNKKHLTLKQWIMNTKCLNLASQPLMNTQFAQLGALDALNDAGLLNKVTGYSGVSSGAFVMAMAASKNFSAQSKKFRKIWPGWGNLVAEGKGKYKDPELSKAYKSKILDQVLPGTFEDLKVPLAVTATKYTDEDAAQKIDLGRSEPIVISDGGLAESVLISSSAMMGKGCPKCDQGFQAKEFRGQWPVADGFLKDEYGTLGLAALKPCANLLHFQPQNYARQLVPTKNRDLDTQPENVVSLSIDVPSSAIMSMGWVGYLENIHRLRRKMNLPEKPLSRSFANMDDEWEKVEYDTSYSHMMDKLNRPMYYDPLNDDEEHYYVELDTKPHWDKMRTKGESMWDDKFDGAHAQYWYNTIERRMDMVGRRNKLMQTGKLSYRACGNGLGAPWPQSCKGKANNLLSQAEQPKIASNIAEQAQKQLKQALDVQTQTIEAGIKAAATEAQKAGALKA